MLLSARIFLTRSHVRKTKLKIIEEKKWQILHLKQKQEIR